MKGTIVVCLRDLLIREKGMTVEHWRDLLQAAGLDASTVILLTTDIDDHHALAIFGEAQKRYYASHEELADAFGNYWCITYAPSIYSSVYRGVKSARDFILQMDQVHVRVTETMANARPPRFAYEEVGDNKLMVHYRSGRGLIHIYAGLCRGIGNYFGEKLDVQVLDNERVAIEFQGAAA